MAAAVERSEGTVRHWLARWGIARRRPTRRPPSPESAPAVAVMRCRRHGETKFRLEGRGYYRCMRCRQARVTAWRRSVKRRLVEEAGGRCRLCGFDPWPAAPPFPPPDLSTQG